MKLHPRHKATTTAQALLGAFLIDLTDDYDLTDIERIQMLTHHIDVSLRYMLRYERHGNYDTPAGQAGD